MSSELERLLRRAREVLPEPGEAATRRARARALRELRGRRRLWRRSTLAVGAAIASAAALGVAAGFVAAPSGTAASGPYGLGFLVAPGWHVLENGGDGTTSRPVVAYASNVPLHSGDDAGGLPYSTLRALPPNGVVMVAILGKTPAHQLRDVRRQYFLPRALPLRLADAVDHIRWGIQLRPERPLGQYELTAFFAGYEIEVNIYFGTERPPPALLAEAQHQLERLIVRPAPVDDRRRKLTSAVSGEIASSPATSTVSSRVIDRTFACTVQHGRTTVAASPRGAREVHGARFTSSGYLRVSSGPSSDPLTDLVAVARPGLRSSGTRFPAAVYASSRGCVASNARVALTRSGIPGPPAHYSRDIECTVRRRVVVRVRAVVTVPARWGRVSAAFVGVRSRVLEAQVAVRDPATGRPLAFARLTRTGTTVLWSSPGCA